MKNPETKISLAIPNFESKINYLPLLNGNYFYDIPPRTTITNPPMRNFVMFSDSNANSPSGGMTHGVTEYIEGANRIVADLWNSNELDIHYAIVQYQANPNRYKPPILPTSRFTIYKTNDTYSNTAMISNDTLFVEIFKDDIQYGQSNIKLGDSDVLPLWSRSIVFPPMQLLNLQEWIDLVNATFRDTKVTIPTHPEYTHLHDILECDWSFFPYTIPMEAQKTLFIKSAVILTQNKTPLTVRLNARISLIQFFGKPLNGQSLDQPWRDQYPNLFEPCDEYAIYGILNARIQMLWPFYSTQDPSVQLPVACMRRDAELIVRPASTFVGIYDGFYNNNINMFTVNFKNPESWVYTNSDVADSHCLHFHLTSGFVTSDNNPQTLLNHPSYNFFYSRDIYQIGAQMSISFYITFPDYPSSNPRFKTIGGVLHCHFLTHNDSNGMMIQFRVDRVVP